METLLKVIAIHVVFCFGLPSASLGSLLLTSRTVYNDATVQPGAYGLEIVKATVAKIDSTCTIHFFDHKKIGSTNGLPFQVYSKKTN